MNEMLESAGAKPPAGYLQLDAWFYWYYRSQSDVL